jgi:hypothetical protein
MKNTEPPALEAVVAAPDALQFLGRCILAAGILTRYNASPGTLRSDVDNYIHVLTS